MARITIPYAIAGFVDLRECGYYYVDKTDYIPSLEDYNAPVFLRPCRFGKSLAGLHYHLDNAKDMLDALVIDDELSYNVADLSSKFNKKKFFDKEFYPISLFYWGMTTLKDSYVMTLPNMTMRSVYVDYYNQLNKIEGNAQRYVPVFELLLYICY